MFEFRDGGIVLVRVGGINFVTQKHYGKEGATHQPPVRKGMWAFPKGLDDPWFYSHQWRNMLPKRLQDNAISAIEDDEVAFQLSVEREAKMREIMRRWPLKEFVWRKGLWSHIPTSKALEGSRLWFYHDSPREWAKIAQGYITYFDREYKMVRTYSRDHLELFLSV